MEQLYRDYGQQVYRFLLSLCKNEELAKDLMQETFLQAYLSLERYNGRCKMSVWLCQIGKHLWYQHLEKHKRECVGEYLEEQPSAESLEDDYIKKEEANQVARLMKQLPELTRAVIVLRVTEERSFAEIGAILNKSENWARVTYFRGKEKLVAAVKREEMA